MGKGKQGGCIISTNAFSVGVREQGIVPHGSNLKVKNTIHREREREREIKSICVDFTV